MVHISPSRWLLAGEAQLAPADKLPRMRACLSPVDVMSAQHSDLPSKAFYKRAWVHGSENILTGYGEPVHGASVRH